MTTTRQTKTTTSILLPPSSHYVKSSSSSSLHQRITTPPLPFHSPSSSTIITTTTTRTTTSLSQSSSNDNDGPNALTATILIGIIILFIVTGIGPLLDGGGGGGVSSDLNLGDAVATRQDSPNSKVMNYQNDFDKLSRSKIQEKLNRIPVFFLEEDGAGTMMGEGKIYLSFRDAEEAAAGSAARVKCTTLDQVMYPLVLKRGRMKMAPPPLSIQKAEEELMSSTTNNNGETNNEDSSSSSSSSMVFRLVPSKAALKDAADEMLTLKDGDVPLFVAERLAFAGQSGPQVPLFLEKADCFTSYNRLKESSKTLPDTPKIKSTTLREVLYSMEKGTRPAVAQLQFYATADDLFRASEMM